MAEIRRFAIFNPASAAPQGRDLTPRLNQVTAATWPADAPEDIPVPVIMMVEVSVDDTGRVTHARAVTEGLPPAFAQIAQTTVTRWTFAPALQEGRPVAAALRVPVLFVGPSGTRIDTLTTPPKVIQRKRPEYPDSMIRTNRQGNVVVGFEVTPEGKTANVHVVRSSHPAFDEPALDAVEQWVFEPGVVNGVPVRTRMAVPIVFSIVDGQSPWKVTRNRRDLAKLPPAFQWDSPPEIENYWPPVYPRHALMNGIRGDVLIGFVVAPDGRVIRAESMREADPTLIAATLAAVETYVFKPATKQGKPCYAALNMEFTFHDRRYSSATISPSASRVIKQLRSSPESLVPVSALDNLPRPRSQRPPVIPVVALQQGRSGRALVEFVVDRRGSVVLPHVLEASSPEFGYAAVQAVSAWRYEIPRRDGRPVDAVLRVPFEFNVREPGSPSDG